jgi:hypothetical protein
MTSALKLHPTFFTRHDDLRDGLLTLIESYGDIPALEILALASQIVGNLIALQDQRAVTPDQALDVVWSNINLGNQAMIAGLLNPAGAA